MNIKLMECMKNLFEKISFPYYQYCIVLPCFLRKCFTFMDRFSREWFSMTDHCHKSLNKPHILLFDHRNLGKICVNYAVKYGTFPFIFTLYNYTCWQHNIKQ